MKNPTPANPTMTDNLLFEHFATLAAAPDGIVRLRELILQLAVQGKLGTQDAGDEPAGKLIERIRTEKERLITEGEIRPDKKVDSIEPSEIPFVLPECWLWVRLGSVLIKLQDGVHNSPDNFENGDFMYVTAKNIKPDGIQLSNITYISAKDHEDSYKRCDPKFGDVLLIKDGATSGIATINNLHEPFSMLSSVALLRPPEEILNKYLLYVLRSPFFYTYLREDMSGCAITRVTLVKLNRFIIPLPPLAEQHRIVAKVDRLMALCDELEARQQQERAGCLRLGTASLAGLQNATHPEEFGRQWAQVCDAFDLILDCPENVAVLRQTILQLAVQGRLVRQEPGDEPAKKLVERIRKEKERLLKEGTIKNDGKYESIHSDEIPFTIPTVWQWIRLGEITQKIGSGSTPRGGKSVYLTTGIPFLRSQNVWNDGLWLNNVAFISPEIHSQMSATHVQPRDILLNITGASIGRSAIVPDNFKEGNVSQHVSIVRMVDETFRNYLHYCIISPYFQNKIMDVQVGMSREGLSKKVLRDLLIPLPPLAEQHRIVAKVDTLMSLCDSLESRLKERAGVQARFAMAVGRQVAG